MDNNRRSRKFIIIILIIIILSMSISFATFSQKLIINGTANVVSNNQWNIVFDDIVSLSTSGYATGNKSTDANKKNLTFSCEFLAQNDSCELSFNIVNKGSINALLKDFNYKVYSDGQEIYSGASNYDGTILNVILTSPVWTNNSTVLEPLDKGSFKIKTLLKNMTPLKDSAKFVIDISFDFEQE